MSHMVRPSHGCASPPASKPASSARLRPPSWLSPLSVAVHVRVAMSGSCCDLW